MNLTLIAGLNALCVQYTDHLKNAFWTRAKARLEEIFSSESSFQERREAIAEGVKRAFSADHWQLLVDCIGTNFLLLEKGVQEEFLSECDLEILEIFVADEQKGLVPITLLALATADALKPEHFGLMHMSLNGLNALTERLGDWAGPRRAVAEIFEGFCVLFGNTPEHLQKRFDAILGSGDNEPMPEVRKAFPPTTPARQIKNTLSAKPTHQPKKVPLDRVAQAKADAARGSATHQPFAGLAKILGDTSATIN